MDTLYSFLIIAGIVFLAVYQCWWLPSHRERELDRRLSKVNDKNEAGIIVDAMIADGKREAEYHREQRYRRG